jgi:hypothetical protein
LRRGAASSRSGTCSGNGGLGARQVHLAVGKPVRSSVDETSDRNNVVLVGNGVDVAALPVPAARQRSVGKVGSEQGVANEIDTHLGSVCGIVGAASDLDEPTSLEANTVSWLSVPEISATLVLGSRGELRRCDERCALLAQLREEVRLPQRGVDLELRYHPRERLREACNDCGFSLVGGHFVHHACPVGRSVLGAGGTQQGERDEREEEESRAHR